MELGVDQDESDRCMVRDLRMVRMSDRCMVSYWRMIRISVIDI